MAGEGLTGTPFSEAALAQARASGKPVFLYFTADWCLTCKVNEANAIDREDVKKAFDAAGVVTMVGDWTNYDPAIARFLEAQGRLGRAALSLLSQGRERTPDLCRRYRRRELWWTS